MRPSHPRAHPAQGNFAHGVDVISADCPSQVESASGALPQDFDNGILPVKAASPHATGSRAISAAQSVQLNISGTLPLIGSDLLIHAVNSGTHEAIGTHAKRRRLGSFNYSGLPKPAPRNAARDAVSHAVVAKPDPTAGSSSRNAAHLQDVPLHPQGNPLPRFTSSRMLPPTASL